MNEDELNGLRASIGLRTMPEEEPEHTLPQRIACAVIALGASERNMGAPFLVTLPTSPLSTVMLGELLLDMGEQAVASEPAPVYDPLLEAPRERFFNVVRDMAKKLQAAAPQKPRLVRPDGKPLRR